MKAYKIGRAPDNDLVLNNTAVSWHHAVVTVISPNTCLLEDLGSTNGTEVNNRRIIKVIITPNSKVMLSKSVPVDIRSFFGQQPAKPKPKPGPAPAPKPDDTKNARENAAKPAPNALPDVSEGFAKLSDVYSHYIETKRALLNKDQIKQAMLQAGCSLIPVIGRAIGTILTAQFLNDDQKLHALDEEFKINYVCPNCGRFLGEFPFKSLVNQKQCSNSQCKAIWAKA